MALTATLGLLLLGSAAQTTTTSGQSGIAMATGTTSTTHMTTRTAYQILVVSARARMVMAGNSSAQALVDAFVYDPAVERAFATGIASGFEDLSPDSVSIRGVSPVASSRRLSQKERRLDSMARVDVAMGITLPASSATARMLQSNPDLLTSVLEVTLDEINRAFSLLPAHSSTNFASIEVSAVSNRLAMNDGSANTQASQGREFQWLGARGGCSSASEEFPEPTHRVFLQEFPESVWDCHNLCVSSDDCAAYQYCSQGWASGSCLTFSSTANIVTLNHIDVHCYVRSPATSTTTTASTTRTTTQTTSSSIVAAPAPTTPVVGAIAGQSDVVGAMAGQSDDTNQASTSVLFVILIVLLVLLCLIVICCSAVAVWRKRKEDRAVRPVQPVEQGKLSMYAVPQYEEPEEAHHGQAVRPGHKSEQRNGVIILVREELEASSIRDTDSASPQSPFRLVTDVEEEEPEVPASPNLKLKLAVGQYGVPPTVPNDTNEIQFAIDEGAAPSEVPSNPNAIDN